MYILLTSPLIIEIIGGINHMYILLTFLIIIGLYLTISGLIDLIKVLHLKHIHNQITKLLEEEKHDLN